MKGFNGISSVLVIYAHYKCPDAIRHKEKAKGK